MSKIYIYLVLGSILFLAAFYFIKEQRDIGGEAERIKQERENAQFIVKARKGAVDYNTCDRANGLYDFAKGTCKLPPNE